ncbi:mitogen-activated protein kinase kinase kinase 14-like isoform X2 [Pseudoliparis swirei]|uniref:mitogen-activated protein kinase kinase kinase 14-like isoform X2 n=1 Tax=Pseudoliparis swirei TaxID=2059687 RepID=UPI0024BE108D|nr:mitogen-activated protein kinase kinase kinase 14-like isoform X2 [Pseudoliparis swirei]
MRRGTANHAVAEGRDATEENQCVSIVAQAEREDFQEFSPTDTQSLHCPARLLQRLRSLSVDAALLSDSEDGEDIDVVAKLPLHQLQRKQRRKTGRRSHGAGGRPPLIQGLWVQELDWLKSTSRESSAASSPADIIPPPPQFTDRSPGAEEDRYRPAGSDSDCSPNQNSESVYSSDSSCAAEDGSGSGASAVAFDLMQVSGCTSSWETDYTGVGVQSPLGVSDSSSAHGPAEAFGVDDTETLLRGLRGRVTRRPRIFASSFFRDLMKRSADGWESAPLNEGLVFHHQLQPSGCRYREGEEYRVLHHIHSGSYGDVFCVRDRRTGFTCAAKRVPLGHFSSREVSAWSALNSPRVVELFGAVREGLNVVLFMELKPACLAQLLKEMNSLPEDLALHYLHQALGALEHLHHRHVLHLDVKVDNVLLSADCRDAFLCDFGLSETSDDDGGRTDAFRGAAFPGTETHMAPEVARGDRPRGAADVWSSCCMLLHMLNGCHPWIRYYSHPLCLQIVNEPPPLWEVPSTCNNFTAKVFRAGLRKDPGRRASAKELRRKTTKALRAVGGLSPRSVKSAREKLQNDKSRNEDTPFSPSPGINPTKPSTTMYWVSPWRTTAVDEDSTGYGDSNQDSEAESDSLTREWESRPKPLQDDYWDTGSDSEVDIYMAEEEHVQGKWPKSDRDYEGDWEEEEEEEEEEEWDSSESTEYLRALRGIFPLLKKGQQTNDSPWGSEPEQEDLREEAAIGTTVQTPSPEPRDDPPSCFSCSDSLAEQESDHSSDDLSSGVFSSSNSHTDGHIEWLASDNQPSSYCFEGVDIWIENVRGECLRIRERRQVKVGHVAIGISDQISTAFTLETLDRKTVSFEQEIRESCLWLRCVPAPDRCQRWRWRVTDGKLELRE